MPVGLPLATYSSISWNHQGFLYPFQNCFQEQLLSLLSEPPSKYTQPLLPALPGNFERLAVLQGRVGLATFPAGVFTREGSFHSHVNGYELSFCCGTNCRMLNTYFQWSLCSLLVSDKIKGRTGPVERWDIPTGISSFYSMEAFGA